MLDAFLESSASQLTRAGLRDARDAVKERELAVFFRNNHFATVFKLDGALYLLATDQGYLREPDVVWETLCAAERPEAERRRGGRLRRRCVRALRAARRTERGRAARRRGRRAARCGAPGVCRGDLGEPRRKRGPIGARRDSRRDSGGDVPARGGKPAPTPSARGAGAGAGDGASADADHALAVALQAEYEEEREREEAAGARARAEAAAATRPPAARPGRGRFGRVFFPARCVTPAKQKVLLQQRMRGDVTMRRKKYVHIYDENDEVNDITREAS